MIENRNTLGKHGINYPKPSGRHPGNGSIVPELGAEALNKLFSDADTLVLSHEDLFSMGARMVPFGEMCKSSGIKLSVVTFLRPFSEFIFGDYSQYLKQNIEIYLENKSAYDGLSFEEFSVHRRSQITPVAWLKGWQKITDTPITIAHHRKIRSVMEGFLDISDLQWEIEKSSVNPSLRVADCEDISNAISGGISKVKVMDMYKLSYSKVNLTDHGKTEERTKWIEAIFKSQNDKIFAEFHFDNRRI